MTFLRPARSTITKIVVKFLPEPDSVTCKNGWFMNPGKAVRWWQLLWQRVAFRVWTFCPTLNLRRSRRTLTWLLEHSSYCTWALVLLLCWLQIKYWSQVEHDECFKSDKSLHEHRRPSKLIQLGRKQFSGNSTLKSNYQVPYSKHLTVQPEYVLTYNCVNLEPSLVKALSDACGTAKVL